MQERPLFSDRDIESVLRSHRERLDRSLAGIDIVAQCDDPKTADRLLKEAQLEVPQLDRAGVTFLTEEKGAEVLVTARIPISQGWYLLDVKPSQFSLNPPSGYAERHGVRPGRPHLLYMTRPFHRGAATPQAIKQWARVEADGVQQWIDWLAVDVALHNGGLEERVAAGLAARRQELQATDDLRGGLEGGI